jgi:hypothetical protein
VCLAAMPKLPQAWGQKLLEGGSASRQTQVHLCR